MINGVLELWMARQRNVGSTESLRHQEQLCSLKHEDPGDKTLSPRKHGFVVLYMLCCLYICLTIYMFCVIEVQMGD